MRHTALVRPCQDHAPRHHDMTASAITAASAAPRVANTRRA